MSIWLKNILPGLILGLLVGSLIVKGSLLEGTYQSVSYIVTTLSDGGNIKIIGFLYLFGGLVGMMNISGGIKGFSEWIGAKIQDRARSAGTHLAYSSIYIYDANVSDHDDWSCR